jgi:hypothetical protein
MTLRLYTSARIESLLDLHGEKYLQTLHTNARINALLDWYGTSLCEFSIRRSYEIRTSRRLASIQ